MCVCVCVYARASSLFLYVYVYDTYVCECMQVNVRWNKTCGLARSHAEERVTASMDHSALLPEIDRPK